MSSMEFDRSIEVSGRFRGLLLQWSIEFGNRPETTHINPRGEITRRRSRSIEVRSVEINRDHRIAPDSLANACNVNRSSLPICQTVVAAHALKGCAVVHFALASLPQNSKDSESIAPVPTEG